MTDEFAPRDPAGGHQGKFYAPGVGNIRVSAGDGANPEVLEMTALVGLCASQMNAVRRQALEQDARGSTVSKTVYGKTPPAEKTLSAASCR
jgi:hypothetical protein